MISKRHKGRLFRVLSKLVLLLAMGNGTSAQNFVAGPMGVYGDTYATFTILTNSNLVIGAGGNWALGGSITSSPRSLANGVAFANQGTYAAATTYQYIDGYVSQTGNTAFTFPLGDAAATVGTAFHPLGITAPSASTTVTTSYIASSATPNANNVSSLVVDPACYWTFGSTTTGATSTVTLAARNENGVFRTGSRLSVAGYNTSTSKWESLGVSVPLLAADQNIVSNSIDVSKYTAFAAAAPFVLVLPKVFLQGALPSGTTMTTSLTAVIPTAQPYGAGELSAFGYTGTEAIAAVPTNMTDWVLVELRDPISNSVIATRAAILLSNGNIVDTTAGFASPVYFPVTAGSYNIAVRHRNHLGIRTDNGLALTSTVTPYDFTTAQSSAYKNPAISANLPMVSIGGAFAMWGGNTIPDVSLQATGNFRVNDLSSIKVALVNINSIMLGVYSLYDVNMDGNVQTTGNSSINDGSRVKTILGNINNIYTQHL